MTNKTILASAVISLLTSAFACNAIADGKGFSTFHFKPIDSSAKAADWNPASPWKLPEGFTQKIISDETDLNIYDGGRDDWHDMNTVNETGPDTGRYLYRTHELRLPSSLPKGGAVSVVDLKTGETKELASDANWDALDGIRWTPWGTILFAEEKDFGRLLEIQLNPDMMSAAAVIERPAVGLLAHEGIEVDTAGNVYIVDEQRGRSESDICGSKPCGGSVYKFVPDTFGDLSSGKLYVLGIDSATRRNGTGLGIWKGPIDPLNARQAGTLTGGVSYQRPEDLEIIGDKLYVAITEGPLDEYSKEHYEGRVISIDLNTMQVADFIKPGVNVPVEIGKPGDANFQTGWDNIDNLAEGPNGELIAIEDNVPSDIWFASTKTNEYGASKNVELFASLTDPEAEGTGIYFSPTDPYTLYVNVQHSAAVDGDGTWAISKKKYLGWKK